MVAVTKPGIPRLADSKLCAQTRAVNRHEAMDSLDAYFSPRAIKAFQTALPRLRMQLGRTPFAERDASFGVGGETFRAYRGWSRQPSELYRSWARGICDRIDIDQLVTHTQTQSSFLAWHETLASKLQAHWRRREQHGLSFAHQHKLVDLLVKWLSAHSFGEPCITLGFERYAHCALDRQTLLKLNECLSYALPLPRPSMGDVINKNTYLFCQTLIRRFASRCDGSPLLFDYFAWRRGG